ncbi:CHAT domain-containing protein [Geodermatophilus sp. CPCC 205506]|uniref:CHAT domain-containing protein n=1 Tax=Geodermatophilus sp. CPCC 205506 TaxID=2936596 RepID=UPI003EE944A6
MSSVRDVRTTPRTGVDTDLEASAVKALQLSRLRPTEARAIGAAILEPARRSGAWQVVSMAERALGVAAMNLGQIEAALTHLRASVAAGRRARSRHRVAQARMSLAAALVVRGQSGQALREMEAVLPDLEGVEAARARVQRAAILQELGRDDAALDEVRRALPVLRQAGDAEWAARALSNRSLIQTSRRAFAAAEADLVDALRLCVEHDLDLLGAFAEQNLGCVKAKRGDVPASLRHFDAADERYRRFGLVEASLLVDRAEVLLSVRLLDEARTIAEAAVAAYRNQQREVRLPEAQLLLSTVALVQGDAATACDSATAAIQGLHRLGRTNLLALARFARLQAQVAADPTGTSAERAARVAEALEAAKWKVPALEARVLAGRIALDQGRRSAARRHLSMASRARHSGPADARVRAWLAEALLRRADGRKAAALSALRAGLRIVEDYQATLGATELRAHVSLQRGSLARLGLRMAIEDQDPRRVIWWAERARASALRLRPAQPPEHPELAGNLADLRSTMAEIEEARGAGRADDALVAHQVLLERRIRDCCRTLQAGESAERRPLRHSVADLTGPLGDAALVEYVELEGDLHAVTVAGGRARLHFLGRAQTVRQVLTHVPFALHRLVKPRAASTGREAAATAVLQRAATAFDDLLLRPLRHEVGDRPLVVVPTGALQSLPWSVLASCHGRPVSVNPSATMWHQAVSRPRPPDDAPVVVVAGPGLPGATIEASTIAALYPGSVLLSEEVATAPTLLARMNGAAVLHLAAHGNVRSDNPLFSSLTLADGPLTVYELERLAQAPHHVVLAACDTGRPHIVAGEELLGFGAALLGGGTATLVAPVVPVPDAATVSLMRSYHEKLRAGHPPSEALAAAQAGFDAEDPAGWAAAAAFVCLGAG